MKEINQILENSETKIFVGASLDYLHKLANTDNTLIITDFNVYNFYKEIIRDYQVKIIPAGEQSKNLDVVRDIYKKLLDLKFDRDSLIIGFGGGVVCDIAGYVASTFKRGINLVLFPTTLLAQIDASIGGKNGVNFNGFKNIVGTFKQAAYIVSDISTLKTLPKEEMFNAYAELVKISLISDRMFFEDLKQNVNKLLDFDLDYLEEIVFRCAKIKSDIVVKDETENNLRRILNFGHTFGHAIESTKNISHGKAVAIGMILSLEFSNKVLQLPLKIVKEVQDLLKQLNLPISIDFDKNKIVKMIRNDKKSYNGIVKFVFLEEIGKPIVTDIDFKKIKSFIDDLS